MRYINSRFTYLLTYLRWRVLVSQALNHARDEKVVELRRRNETERFLSIEVENNSQLRSRIEQARRELASATVKLGDADVKNTDFSSEVTNNSVVSSVALTIHPAATMWSRHHGVGLETMVLVWRS